MIEISLDQYQKLKATGTPIKTKQGQHLLIIGEHIFIVNPLNSEKEAFDNEFTTVEA